MDFYSISEKRQTQIEDFLKSPLTVGEEVYVTDNYFSSYKSKRDEWRIYKVLDVNDTTLTFDYDVRTKPESQQQEKIIYDNNDDLYDGEYHD